MSSLNQYRISVSLVETIIVDATCPKKAVDLAKELLESKYGDTKVRLQVNKVLPEEFDEECECFYIPEEFQGTYIESVFL